jgi:hypothetical protein
MKNDEGGVHILKKLIVIMVILCFSTSLINDIIRSDEGINVKLTHEGTIHLGTEGSDSSSRSISSMKDYLIIVHDALPVETHHPIVAAAHYEVCNSVFVEENIGFDYMDMSVSLLAPVIELEIADITRLEDEIEDLAMLESVLHIYTRTEIIHAETLVGGWGPPEADDGSGGGGASPEYDTSVKVGVYDGGRIDADYAHFHNLDIIEYDDSVQLTLHTTEVGAIIASEYGNNDFLSLHTIHMDVTTIDAMNWLIVNQQVDIINMSIGDLAGEGEYNFLSKYIDYIIYQYRIPIIKSAGNRGMKRMTVWDDNGEAIETVIQSDHVTIPDAGLFEPSVFEAIYPNRQVYSNNHNTQNQLVYYKDINIMQNQRIITRVFSLRRMHLHPSGEYRPSYMTDFQIQNTQKWHHCR